MGEQGNANEQQGNPEDHGAKSDYLSRLVV